MEGKPGYFRDCAGRGGGMWWVLLHVGRCEVQFLESLYDNIVCGMIIINIMWVADRPVVIGVWASE